MAVVVENSVAVSARVRSLLYKTQKNERYSSRDQQDVRSLSTLPVPV